MEIINTKNNNQIVIKRINFEKLHIIFDKNINFKVSNQNGQINILNIFKERVFSVGGRLFFEKMLWNIKSIEKLKSENLNEFVLKISPVYSNTSIYR